MLWNRNRRNRDFLPLRNRNRNALRFRIRNWIWNRIQHKMQFEVKNQTGEANFLKINAASGIAKERFCTNVLLENCAKYCLDPKPEQIITVRFHNTSRRCVLNLLQCFRVGSNWIKIQDEDFSKFGSGSRLCWICIKMEIQAQGKTPALERAFFSNIHNKPSIKNG